MPNYNSPGGGYSGGSQAYNPFDPMYLYKPLAGEMDIARDQEAGQLKEQFGQQGARYSGNMMDALSALDARTAQQKQQTLADLMYKGAQDAYGRQKDAATMNMQLGSMQNQRDMDLTKLLQSLGMGEQQWAQQGLDAQQKEWLRQQGGFLEYIMKLMGGGASGYNSDFLRDPSTLEKYGGYANLIGSILAML